MKRILSFSSLAIFCSILGYTNANAQSVGISSGAAITPSARSILELRSTSKGLLIPRMTASERAAISGLSATGNDSSDRGMLVFQYDGGPAAGYYYWDGTAWVALLNASTGITSISIPANIGDMLYYGSSGWVVLNVPGTPPSPSPPPSSTYYALTLPNSGSGIPTWQPTDAFSVDGDGLGNSNATMRLNMDGNRITNDPSPTGAEGIGLDSNGNVSIGTAVDVAYALKIAGKMNSNGINETSDLRFKRNIEGITNALDIVSQLRGVTYDWRMDEFPERNFSEGRDMGVIAQEIELLVPEVVSTGSDGYKAVEYGHLVGLLIEAIKEQQGIIDEQQCRITSLEGMKNQLDTLKASVELLNEHIRTSQK